MMHKTCKLTGSFLLSQRLVPDWWQKLYREDIHQRAKSRLTALFNDTAAAASSAHLEDAGGEGSRDTGDGEFRESQHRRRHSATSTSSSSGGGGGGAGDTNTTAVAPTSLYEVNGLVATFTGQGNTEDLSATLQYLREELGEELAPYHYHSLLRVFTHSQDKENALQLIEVMLQRGEMTQETYARVMDCLHVLAPVDVLELQLQVCTLAQRAFDNTLVFEETAGSEGATVAGFGTGCCWRDAVASPGDMPGPMEVSTGDGDGQRARRTSPVLTSLLHHVATGGEYSALCPLIVCVWKRALGVELSDWDYAVVLATLLSKADDFPRVRSVLGFMAAFPVGSVSPQEFMKRLVERGECANAPVQRLVDAMQTSLIRAKVDLTAPVSVGVVNVQANDIHVTMEHIVAYAAQRSAASRYGFDIGVLHHLLTLLHSTTRDSTSAVRAINNAFRSRAMWRDMQSQREEDIFSSLAAAALTAKDGAVETRATGEPFTVLMHHMVDVGTLFPHVSTRILQEISAAYIQLARDAATARNEMQLQATSTAYHDMADIGGSGVSGTGEGDGEEDATARAEKVQCLAGILRNPNALDVIACESYVTPLLKSNEEAQEALKRAVSMIDTSRNRLPRSTRLMLRQFALFCSRHPRPNCKYTATGLEERRKWGAYLDARDTSLSLFGSTQQARDSMKYLFYHQNCLPELRAREIVDRDIADVAFLFFDHSQLVASAFTSAADNSNDAAVKVVSETFVHDLLHQRTTLPHLRCSSDAVPRYLWDPSVSNPYPHASLALNPLTPDAVSDDFFLLLWRTIMDHTTMGTDMWYVQNTDMYLLLMRCLLHRLDWEAATHLTARMLEHSSYTYLMDHELALIFKEIGDPAGCLAFKVATKLFDGRITRNGQTKREQFHQEQFR